MLVNISGNHFYVSDALRQFTKTKVCHALENYIDTSYVDVVLTVDNKAHVAVANIVFLGKEIEASGRSDDMYRSVTDMSEKLEKLVHKRKEVVKSHPNVKLLFEQSAGAGKAQEQGVEH